MSPPDPQAPATSRHFAGPTPGANATGPAERTASSDGGPVAATLAALREHLDTDRVTNIGFPSTFDFDYTPLWPFFNDVLNNVGDPYAPSAFPANTKHLEREVIDTFADLMRAPRDDRWGYVTTGGTEGSEYGLLLARTLLPDAMTYFSKPPITRPRSCLPSYECPPSLSAPNPTATSTSATWPVLCGRTGISPQSCWPTSAPR